MNCSEFQRVLPEIIESGGNQEQEAHLANCTVCSDLVRDLRYIAEVAKLLVPMEDPDPRVWDGIEKTLEREGLIKRKHMTRSAGRMTARIVMMVASMAVLQCLQQVLRA
ncbi:MAG: hypothetical protein JO041_09425 [Acidobacteria bacterium]|nr:hypothetical protein [Acidobacteriota bacterium]